MYCTMHTSAKGTNCFIPVWSPETRNNCAIKARLSFGIPRSRLPLSRWQVHFSAHVSNIFGLTQKWHVHHRCQDGKFIFLLMTQKRHVDHFFMKDESSFARFPC